jgi:hypothetical protein
MSQWMVLQLEQNLHFKTDDFNRDSFTESHALSQKSLTDRISHNPNTCLLIIEHFK